MLPTRKMTRSAHVSTGLQSFGDLDAYLRGNQGDGSQKEEIIGHGEADTSGHGVRATAHPHSFCGRVLVADDDEDTRQYVLRILGAELYDIEVSGDGAEILELTRARQYDLLLLQLISLTF